MSPEFFFEAKDGSAFLRSAKGSAGTGRSRTHNYDIKILGFDWVVC